MATINVADKTTLDAVNTAVKTNNTASTTGTLSQKLSSIISTLTSGVAVSKQTFAKSGTTTTLKSTSNISSTSASTTAKHLECYIPYDGYYRVDLSITLTVVKNSSTKGYGIDSYACVYDGSDKYDNSYQLVGLSDWDMLSPKNYSVGDTINLTVSNKTLGFLKKGSRITISCCSSLCDSSFTLLINSASVKYTSQTL